jgi:hypothetical protein
MAAVTPETILLTRGANPLLTSTINWTAIYSTDAIPAPCNYEGVVSFSHPMSLSVEDKHFATGQLQLKAIEMMVDEINASPRCGVSVDGNNYGIVLTTVRLLPYKYHVMSDGCVLCDFCSCLV